jgi:hypothetical protein
MARTPRPKSADGGRVSPPAVWQPQPLLSPVARVAPASLASSELACGEASSCVPASPAVEASGPPLLPESAPIEPESTPGAPESSSPEPESLPGDPESSDPESGDPESLPPEPEPESVPGDPESLAEPESGEPESTPASTAHVSSVATTADFVQVAGLEHSALVVQATQ